MLFYIRIIMLFYIRIIILFYIRIIMLFYIRIIMLFYIRTIMLFYIRIIIMLFYNFLFIFDRVNYYIIKAWCRLKYQLYCSTDEDSYFIYCFKLINDSTYPNDSAH